jgi:hypothetical protein
VNAFAGACTDPGAREKYATAAIHQAGLLESIVDKAQVAV